MHDDVYGTLTIYLNVPHGGFDGQQHAKLCAITSVRCTRQQAKGLKADWQGMNGKVRPGEGGPEWCYRWRAEEFL